MKKPLILILVAFYIYLGVHFKPWTAFAPPVKAWDIIFACAVMLALIGLAVSYLGLLFGKRANLACLLFNALYLILGCYAAYIFWTLWIFQTPTLMMKITHTLPAFIFGICLPLSLMYYHLKATRK